MEIVTEYEIDFKDMEQYIYEECCQAGRAALTKWIEDLDQTICEGRDKKKYRYINKRETTIKTVMGEVTYSRICYKEKMEQGTRYRHLLDEALGLSRQCGLVSEGLAEKIVNECLDKSYRKAAVSISTLTGQQISHAGAWNLVQQWGALAGVREDRLVKLHQANTLCGETESKVLFEEMDGIWLSMQRKDRPKNMGKRELKLATSYSGWRATAKNRYETIDKIAYAGFDAPKEFHLRREAVTASRYNLDEVEIRILNGDGAAWIKGLDGDVIQQLDPFHRSRAVMRGVANPDDRKTLLAVIREKNTDNILKCVEALYNGAADKKEAEKLRKLQNYFEDNKDKLLTWDERGIKLPEPPEGIVYRRLGTQEHSNCDIITQRMKRRKASWSIQGASNMAKLLCCRWTTSLSEILNKVETTVLSPQEMAVPLSSAQAPRRDGKGKNGSIPRVEWPLEGAAINQGRKAIRGLFDHKSLSTLAIR